MEISKAFLKHRTRLLIICKNDELRNDLVTLLSGYGYFVDYASDRRDGLRRFGEYKHAIVIVDVPTLPRVPRHFFTSFRIFTRNPIILIAAHENEMTRVYPYLRRDVYDVVQLPLNMGYLDFILKRLVAHHQQVNRHEFVTMTFLILFLIAPIWIVLLHVVLRTGGP